MDLVIRNAILDSSGEPIEIGIRAGRIAGMQREGLAQGRIELDAQGGMVSPALFESHFHLDKALLWQNHPNKSGTLMEAIGIYTGIREQLDEADITRRAGAVLQTALRNGVLWLRSHVDVDDEISLRILRALVAVRQEFRDRIRVELVAFPQHGMASDPRVVEMMWKAMEAGCDLVGGMPHGEKDMEAAGRQIEIAFEIARHYNTGIDMHIDETDDPTWHTLELLADQTIGNGWQGRVCASHCVALSLWEDKDAGRIIGKVRQAGISVITNPAINLLLQSRQDAYPKRRGVTRIKQLMEAGVNVVCGQDDMLDMFYPFGNLDPLEAALMAAHCDQLSSPEEIRWVFDMPRSHAARAWGIQGYGIEPGAPANLIVLQESTPVDALRLHQARRWVIREGRVLLANQSDTHWFDRDPIGS